MFSRRIQQGAGHLVALIMQPLADLRVTSNALVFLPVDRLLVLFAGIFDMFDGAMARVRNTATTFGAFFDSTLDRYSESIILFGLLWYALQRPDLHDAFWPAPHEQTWMVTFIFIAAVGSLMVSYAKARAEGLGLECKTGLLARPERVVILAVGLLSGTTIWALALLAVFSHVTAIERLVYMWRRTEASSRPYQAPGMSGARSHDNLDPAQVPGSEQESRDVTLRPSALDLSSSKIVGASETRDTPVPTSFPPFSSGVQQE